MFSKIDNRIIDVSQWTVRWFELYTSIERKVIIDFNLSLIKIMMPTFFLLTLVRYFMAFSVLSFIDFLFLLSLVFNYKEWKEIHQKKEPKETLPKEIITRERQRMFSTFLFTAALLLSFSAALLIFATQENQKLFLDLFDLIKMFQGLCVCLLVVLIFFIEYLLCTTSLPGGEKEKKETERELKNLIPQKTSG